ncbi:acyltransferase [Streptomyces sp. NPDC005538]|uniref:acyltransferase family protein n=1 Tax=unclassified Streptomyces TaxID=2593676 RepID=UPI00339FA31A
MTQAPPGPLRLPTLTTLRFGAAFAVFVSHAAFFGGVAAGIDLSRLYPLGGVGVSFFFVLSGFVLTHSARDGDTAPAFWGRRFFKIFPNHVVVWTAIILLIHLAGLTRVPPTAKISTLNDVSNLLLVETLFPKAPTGAGNGVAWSLTCELVFYLLFPVLLPMIRRIPARRLTAAAVLGLVVVWSVPLVSLAFAGPPAGGPLGAEMSVDQLVFTYFWPLVRLPEFVLGILLARIHHEGPRRLPGLPTAFLLFVVSLLAAPLLPPPFRLTAVTALPLALLILAGAAHDTRGRKSPLNSRTGVFLGDISYAFYLIHFTALVAVFQIADGRLPAAAVAIALAIALGAARLLYTTVELPVMQRHLARARQRRTRGRLTPEHTTP